MRKLAALIFCLLCAQGTVIAQLRQPVIIGAAVDSANGKLYVSGQQFDTTPTVAIDNMLVTVDFASPEMIIAELPKSALAQPGTYLLTITTSQGAKGTASFVIAVGAIGPEGPRGEAGEPGAKGDVGPEGPQGDKGDKGDKGDAGAAGAAGAKGDTGDKGDKGDAGIAGAAGAKGDKGDPGVAGAAGAKGDPGPAGQGSARVVDTNGNLVGSFVSPDAVILNIGDDWMRISLNGAAFTSCSTASAMCTIYYYEQAGCQGKALMSAENGLAQPAFVIDDVIRYPAGAVADRPIGSISNLSGSMCLNYPPGFTQRDAEAKSAPVSSLGLSGAFHLAR